MEVRIRDSVREDLPAIAELLRQLWPDRKVTDAGVARVFERFDDDEDCYLLTAEADGAIAAFTCGMFFPSFLAEDQVARIAILVVDGNFRDRGIGTRLINRTIEMARKRGCKKVELETAFHRIRAQAFYENLKFEQAAIYYIRDI